MMRLRLATGRRALVGAMIVAALIVFLPLRLLLGLAALDDQGFAAREVTGSVWEGHMAEARFGDMPLGDLDASVAPLPLLIGRAHVALRRRATSEETRLRGVVEISRHRAAVLNARGTISPGSAFAPLPVTALTLDHVGTVFTDGVCESAEGQVSATLSGTFQGAPLPGAVSGPARCDGGALLLPLASGSGEGVSLRLWADGRYRAELSLIPSDPAVAERLDQSGFVAEGATRRLAVEGRF